VAILEKTKSRGHSTTFSYIGKRTTNCILWRQRFSPRATSIASGAMPKPRVSKPPPKTLAAEKRSVDQASEVVESKLVTRAQKEEDPSWEPPKKKGRIPLKKEGASTKKEVTKAKVVQKPVKANAEGTTQSEVPAPSKDKVPIAKYSSEEDDEREDAGDEYRGLFTITEKSTLKWDLLDDTLHRLQDTRKVPLPPVPLCRLLPHPAVRPVQDHVHNLALEFSRNGYVPHRARFMLSIRTLDLDSIEVSHAIRKTWDPIWMQLNEEFEKQLHKSGWGDVKGKMLYTWDGNHRLRAWNAQIDTVHKEEPKYHCCVEACMVKATTESEGLQDAICSNEMETIIGLPYDANVTITEVSTGLSTVAETGHRGEPALLVGDVMVQCNTPPHDEAQNSMAHSSDSAVLAIDPMGAADETGKGDPDSDVIFDYYNASHWQLKTDGCPWRGGMERSPTLHEKLLSFYTEEGNVVLQMYAGCGLLACPGLRMGRHVLLLDRQESMEELQHLRNVSAAHGGKVEHTMEETFGLGGDAVMAHSKM
ncbi:hypothetical protein GOP47_0003900, partial [Adiantum capillus-veneris]